jgi:hypothetical protein
MYQSELNMYISLARLHDRCKLSGYSSLCFVADLIRSWDYQNEPPLATWNSDLWDEELSWTTCFPAGALNSLTRMHRRHRTPPAGMPSRAASPASERPGHGRDATTAGSWPRTSMHCCSSQHAVSSPAMMLPRRSVLDRYLFASGHVPCAPALWWLRAQSSPGLPGIDHQGSEISVRTQYSTGTYVSTCHCHQVRDRQESRTGPVEVLSPLFLSRRSAKRKKRNHIGNSERIWGPYIVLPHYSAVLCTPSRILAVAGRSLDGDASSSLVLAMLFVGTNQSVTTSQMLLMLSSFCAADLMLSVWSSSRVKHY